MMHTAYYSSRIFHFLDSSRFVLEVAGTSSAPVMKTANANWVYTVSAGITWLISRNVYCVVCECGVS
jgi:hypothetical protein